MLPTSRVLSSHVHKPLIRFLGRRKWPSEPEPQHPHPGAPAEFKDAFSDFLKKFETSSTRKFVAVEPKKDAVRRTTVNSNVYENFWEAPSRLWRPKAKEITKEEMNAVVSGGASTYY